MSHYNLIHDENQIAKFLEIFYAPLENIDYVLPIVMFARRKYNSNLSRGEILLNKIFIDSSDNIINVRKIKKLNVPMGCYRDGDNDIPNNSLIIYGYIVPKDPVLALNRTMTKYLEDMRISRNTKIHKLYNSEILRSDIKGNGAHTIIDLDTKDDTNIQKTKQILQQANVLPFIVICVETKNGYHIVFKKDVTIDRKMLHDFKKETEFDKKSNDGKNIKDYWFSISRANMIVLPGTYQGGFKASIKQDLFD